MKELNLLLKDFEKKFGFETYEAIKSILYTYYRKVEDITKSRDKWKMRYYLLRDAKEDDIK